MKKVMNKKFMSAMLSATMCISGVQAFSASAGTTYTENKTGVEDGYAFELWKDTGNTSMTLNGGGKFSCQWSNINNCLFRKGQKFDCTKTYDQLGNITIDYGVDYQPDGNSYMCVYGWSRNPLIEYYIVETWGSWRPPGEAEFYGQTVIDGGTYDIYRTQRVDKPSIDGDTTFYQYWSVRTEKPKANGTKIEGTISVSQHFKAWEKAGLKLGKMYEVALNIEGYQSQGKADVYKNDLKIENSPIPDPGTSEPDIPSAEPDANGYYFKNSFDKGSESWTSRGDASVETDSKNYYDGNSSLKISGRKDKWHGASVKLDTSAFVPGNTYSIGTAVLQKSGSAQEARLTLEYKDASGKTNYSTVASATAKSGEWTDLSNTKYTIPSGAKSLLLYVEMPDSLEGIWIDNAYGAVSGTASGIKTGNGVTEEKGTAVTTTTTSFVPAVTTTTTTTAKPVVTDIAWGDANCDGKTDVADAVLILQSITNPDQYTISDEGKINSDVYNVGDGITASDALSILKKEAGIIDKLPESYSEGYTQTTAKPVSPAETTTTTTKPVPPAETTTSIVKPVPSAETTTTTVNPSETATDYYLSASFENGSDNWKERGSTVLSLDTANYYSGKSSLKVSGRQDNWQGACYSLDSSTFKAGSTYSFSSAVLQGSGKSEEMKLTLQYNDASGETKYSTIASENTNSGEWTKLENTSYTIPVGATDLLLYVESSDSLTDFYIDDVEVSSEGKQSSVTTGGGTVSLPTAEQKSPVNTGDVDISWIDPDKPMVAISFDDGAKSADPSSSSMRIINAIADSGFHSTFFYVGNWITENNKEEVRYAFQKGMEIANHSTTHPKLTEISADEIRKEFDTTDTKLASIIGTNPSKLLRLPYLACNQTVQSTLSDVPLITCSIDTADWNGATSQQIINTIKSAMDNGTLKNSIVLCHETYDSTAEAMEYLAPYLKSKGWQIVSISEMFAVNGKELEGGTVYSKCN